jgi:hypothetical protein
MTNAVPGKVCVVDRIPDCDFCAQDGRTFPGPYDFRTVGGSWAHGCDRHWRQHRAEEGLGVGKAQLWTTA